MPLQRSERHVTLFRKQLGAGAGPATVKSVVLPTAY